VPLKHARDLTLSLGAAAGNGIGIVWRDSRIPSPSRKLVAYYDAEMAAGRDAVEHAGSMYRRTLAWLRHPLRRVENEAEHLLEIERAGESAETPAIAIFGIILFLLPIVLVILGLAFAAYYLAG
jgi:hypothetical protein